MEKKVIISATLLRWIIAILSMPITKIPVRRRFKTWIDAGKLPKCRVCVYVPKPDSGLQKADIESRGILMHLHGGGWTICQPETETALCKFMAEKLGVIVVAPDYCKAPQYPFPCALEQLYSVLTWIAGGDLANTLKEHGYDSSFNPNKIALSGGSAGSNLAASLTLLTQERPLPGEAHIAGLGILYPVLNLAVSYEDKLARADPNLALPSCMSKLFLKSYLPPSQSLTDPFVSPALAAPEKLAKFPPTVIMTADYDYLAEEADQFAKALTDLGVRVDHKRFSQVGHAFDGMPARNRKQRALNHGARDAAWGMMAYVFEEVLKDERVNVKDVVRRSDMRLKHKGSFD